MLISARCEYACRALLELAIHWPNKAPLQIQAIAKRQKIPLRYLVHILIQLKRMELVLSMRGRAGGYSLNRSPSEISLGEVLRQMGGPLLPLAKSGRTKDPVFEAIWKEVESSMAKILDRITFEDIINKARELKRTIVYQI